MLAPRAPNRFGQQVPRSGTLSSLCCEYPRSDLEPRSGILSQIARSAQGPAGQEDDAA
jgi:hypothetical protein